MTFFASYFTRDVVGQGDRDITRDQDVIAYDYDSGQYFVADYLQPSVPGDFVNTFSIASGTPPWGFISNNPANAFNPAVLNLNPNFGSYDHDCNPATPNVSYNTTAARASGALSFNDLGQLTPRSIADVCLFANRATGSSLYNFSPVNYLVTPYSRWNMALTGRYDISDAIRLKIVANYTDSSQEVALAATPATGVVVQNPLTNVFIMANGACGVASCHPDLLAALNSRPNPNGVVHHGPSFR